MKKNIVRGILGLAVIAFTSCSKSDSVSDPTINSVESATKKGPQQSAAVSYGGQAIALDATIISIQNGTVLSNQTLVANTTLLPITGGSLTATDASVNLQNVVTAEVLNAGVSGTGNQTQATSSVSAFRLTVNGYVITADQVSASATAVCGSTTGSSQISNLVVNGQTVTITGAPNQMVFFPTGGYVLINSQSVSKGKTKTITVTGLRIVIPNSVEINVATAKAEVKC